MGLDLDGYELCFRGIVKYPDCNSTLNLFGGKLLLWLDEYVAISASSYMGKGGVVTKKFSEMIFEVPTEIGKVVSIYSKVASEGRTSLTMHAVAVKSNISGTEEEVVANATIVYVSVNERGLPEIWNL